MAVPIRGSRVLVTGAGRGLGRVFVRTLIDRGAAKVYASTRSGAPVFGSTAPLRLDITDPGQVAEAAETCSDVNVLINNAGVMHRTPLISAADTEGARAEMETNYFGTLAMCRAFAPVLARNGGGALVNILSAAAWFAMPFNGSYCASKSAEWSLTNAARVELRAQGTLVVGVFASVIDTALSSGGADAPKVSPESVVQQTLAAVEAGEQEVLADSRSQAVKAAVPTDLDDIYPGVQSLWDAGAQG
ncbi:SDR family oxidoreductase [Allonocardiopsis opalescens]|uniref:Short-subunit dehydrogenase n=1 Tax=Allonocardiopsis opalescens TaxID=1144618 RepID=A0A2T0PZ17_9ACTN|nr:SDR family oxidoreductase [Allonocardiopsis opalescens]PRX96784.1 short-subunit dehydrogenase [Allonocardiopsis opalescens]